MTKSTSTGSSPSSKDSESSDLDESVKCMGPGLAPGSQWKIGILGKSRSSTDTTQSKPLPKN